jgi:hypothetical protein
MLRQVIGFGPHATASALIIVLFATAAAQQTASISPSCEPSESLRVKPKGNPPLINPPV